MIEEVIWYDPNRRTRDEELEVGAGLLVLRRQLDLAQVEKDPMCTRFVNTVASGAPVVNNLVRERRLRRLTNHHAPAMIPEIEIMGYKSVGIDATKFDLLGVLGGVLVERGKEDLLKWWEKGDPTHRPQARRGV